MVLRCCIISLLNGLAKRKTLNWFSVRQQERANFLSLDQLPLSSHADGRSRLHTSERHKEGLGNGEKRGKSTCLKAEIGMATLELYPGCVHCHQTSIYIFKKRKQAFRVSHPCQERRRKPRSQHAIACYGVKSTTVKVQSLNSQGRKTFSPKKREKKTHDHKKKWKKNDCIRCL